MVVTIDSEEKCLLLYPATIFSSIEKKINDLPSFTKNHRRIQRLIIGHAEDLELDSSGRILLPKPLRLVAEMSKKINIDINTQACPHCLVSEHKEAAIYCHQCGKKLNHVN
jgi:division/cell wall cluster transcriptional repressor MraZ